MLTTAVLLVLFTGCSNEQKPVPLSDYYSGVWANEDCELVRTSQFMLLIQRHEDKLNAVVTKYDISGDTIFYETRASVMFDTTKKKIVMQAKDLIHGGERIVNNDEENLLRLSSYEYIVEDGADSAVLRFFDKPLEIVYKKENRLRYFAPNGTWQTMEKIENIEVTEPYEMRKLTEDNIGECLQEWSLGVGHLNDPTGLTIGLPINTNRHTYQFAFVAYSGGLNVICRAGRIRSNNRGSLFNINIAMISSGETFITEMPENNLATAAADLIIADSMFMPNGANLTDDGEYWSLKALEDSVITLNGNGQFYNYTPISPASNRLLEWFKFIDYEKAGLK